MQEMYTVLTQIEAVLNSRPLMPISDDVNDLEALTPAHFLIGEPLISIPQETPNEELNLLKKWKLTQQIVKQFWNRWSDEFISRLQQRPKWMKTKPNMEPGQLVLVKSENYPPLMWPLARIIEVHPGADGLVRVATIKLHGRITKRPIVKLAVLPIEDHHPVNIPEGSNKNKHASANKQDSQPTKVNRKRRSQPTTTRVKSNNATSASHHKMVRHTVNKLNVN
ncbi:uncharacterized protein LOC119652107 [Hermetia illucens]|uniref:uncharacterized protein LOC119652107 n=1 Tax=Hermetia illucens TaxID=343691 RepID=UPI0018CC6F7B|nr:uncharacterized protein LOC119652107 [Hermetia illucens]